MIPVLISVLPAASSKKLANWSLSWSMYILGTSYILKRYFLQPKYIHNTHTSGNLTQHLLHTKHSKNISRSHNNKTKNNYQKHQILHWSYCDWSTQYVSITASLYKSINTKYIPLLLNIYNWSWWEVQIVVFDTIHCTLFTAILTSCLISFLFSSFLSHLSILPCRRRRRITMLLNLNMIRNKRYILKY